MVGLIDEIGDSLKRSYGRSKRMDEKGMHETDEERKKRETLESLRRNQTEIPKGTASREMYYDPQTGRHEYRDTMDLGGNMPPSTPVGTTAKEQGRSLHEPEPGASPSPSPSPSSTSTPKPAAKPKGPADMTIQELQDKARGGDVSAASELNRRKRAGK